MKIYYAWVSNKVKTETLEAIKKLHDSDPNWKELEKVISDLSVSAFDEGKESVPNWSNDIKRYYTFFVDYIKSKF